MSGTNPTVEVLPSAPLCTNGKREFPTRDQALGQTVYNLLGGASEEFGSMLTDVSQYVRLRVAEWIANRAKKIRDKRGIAGSPSPKVVIPCLIDASKEGIDEDDDPIREMWAHLIGTSTSDTTGFDLICKDIVSQLGSGEARMLLRLKESHLELEKRSFSRLDELVCGPLKDEPPIGQGLYRTPWEFEIVGETCYLDSDVKSLIASSSTPFLSLDVNVHGESHRRQRYEGHDMEALVLDTLGLCELKGHKTNLAIAETREGFVYASGISGDRVEGKFTFDGRIKESMQKLIKSSSSPHISKWGILRLDFTFLELTKLGDLFVSRVS